MSLTNAVLRKGVFRRSSRDTRDEFLPVDGVTPVRWALCSFALDNSYTSGGWAVDLPALTGFTSILSVQFHQGVVLKTTSYYLPHWDSANGKIMLFMGVEGTGHKFVESNVADMSSTTLYATVYGY